MFSIRVFVSLITVLVILNTLDETGAQSGSFVDYETTNSTFGRGMARANSMFNRVMNTMRSGTGS